MGQAEPAGVEEALLREEELLEGMPLPGVPGHEKTRRETWLKIPRRARAAIRKMHREWGHVSKTMLRKMLKAAKAPQEYLDAVDCRLCSDCAVDAPKAQTSKVGPPRPYEFNHTVGVDVFDLHDYEGTCFLFLNIVDMGTNFQIVVCLCEGPGNQTSRACGEA